VRCRRVLGKLKDIFGGSCLKNGLTIYHG